MTSLKYAILLAILTVLVFWPMKLSLFPIFLNEKTKIRIFPFCPNLILHANYLYQKAFAIKNAIYIYLSSLKSYVDSRQIGNVNTPITINERLVVIVRQHWLNQRNDVVLVLTEHVVITINSIKVRCYGREARGLLATHIFVV